MQERHIQLKDTQLSIIESYADVRIKEFCDNWILYLNSLDHNDKCIGALVLLSTLVEDKVMAEAIIDDHYPQASHPNSNRNLKNLGCLIRGEKSNENDPDKLLESLTNGRVAKKVTDAEDMEHVRGLVGQQLKQHVFSDIKEPLQAILQNATFPMPLGISWNEATPEIVYSALSCYMRNQEANSTEKPFSHNSHHSWVSKAGMSMSGTKERGCSF